MMTTFQSAINATTDTIVRISVSGERTDEKHEGLQEMVETELPKLQEAIDILTKRLDEDTKDHQIAELEDKVKILTKKNYDLASEVGILCERIEVLEKKKLSLIDIPETTNIDEYMEAFTSSHDGRFFSTENVDSTLFGAIWQIATMVINDVEIARSRYGFVWDNTMFERTLRMRDRSDQEIARIDQANHSS
jgi:hypothetical protein